MQDPRVLPARTPPVPAAAVANACPPLGSTGSFPERPLSQVSDFEAPSPPTAGLRQQPRRYAPPPVGQSVHANCSSSSVIPVRFAFEASSGSVYSETLGHGLKRSLPVMGARRAGTPMLPYTLTRSSDRAVSVGTALASLFSLYCPYLLLPRGENRAALLEPVLRVAGPPHDPSRHSRLACSLLVSHHLRALARWSCLTMPFPSLTPQ